MSNSTEFSPCISCASEIPASAKKCSVCGSYQNLRRFLDFGNSTLALAIAFLGLLTTLPSTINSLASIFQTWQEEKHVARVIALDADTATIYVRNASPQDILIHEMQCLVRFERERGKLARSMLLAQSRGERASDVQLLQSEAINPLLVSYQISPQIVPPETTQTFEMQRDHWAIVGPAEDSSEPVLNYCGINFGISDPTSESELTKLRYQVHSSFDLVRALHEAEITSMANATREDIIDMLVGYED